MTSRERESLCDLPRPRQRRFVGISSIISSNRSVKLHYCSLALYCYPSQGRLSGFRLCWTRLDSDEIGIEITSLTLLRYSMDRARSLCLRCLVRWAGASRVEPVGHSAPCCWTGGWFLLCLGAHSLDKAVVWRFNLIKSFCVLSIYAVFEDLSYTLSSLSSSSSFSKTQTIIANMYPQQHAGGTEYQCPR